jgi:hypothetical protein
MPRQSKSAATPPKKTKSKSTGGSLYTSFMKTELPRLKALHPDLDHKEIFKRAAAAWRTSDQNPKATSSKRG